MKDGINREILQNKITESGLKLKFIAHKVGMKSSIFSRKLNGDINFSIIEIKNISYILGIKLEKLLTT